MTIENESEILKQLSEIKNEMTRLSCGVESTNSMCKRHQSWLECHERELGGSPGIDGLRTDIKELKTAQKTQVWYWRAVVAAFLGSILAQVWQLLGGHKP